MPALANAMVVSVCVLQCVYISDALENTLTVQRQRLHYLPEGRGRKES